ncbi:hypothetical protein EG329_004965 [Mollisiaceae sp. DMI_Dod_QoI]|nr:hypothetical protein EG329_004965 [Helotiales sp. DMI_Dod_QoI]
MANRNTNTFTLFPLLPIEIRRAIWGHALADEPATSRIISPILTKERKDEVARGRKKADLKLKGEFSHQPPNKIRPDPSLCWVNKESREAVAKYWCHRKHYMSYYHEFVNFELDRFSFEHYEFGLKDSFLVDIWNGHVWPKEYLNISKDDISKMKKITIGFTEFEIEEISPWMLTFVGKWLQWFTSLQEVRIEIFYNNADRQGPLGLAHRDPAGGFLDITEEISHVVLDNRYKWVRQAKNAKKNWHGSKRGKGFPDPLLIFTDKPMKKCLGSFHMFYYQ